MPYIPINCYPRNTTIERNPEGYTFLGSVDPHDNITDVDLILCDKFGEELFTVNNTTGKYEEDGNIVLDFNNSSRPNYNIENSQIQMVIKTEDDSDIENEVDFSYNVDDIVLEVGEEDKTDSNYQRKLKLFLKIPFTINNEEGYFGFDFLFDNEFDTPSYPYNDVVKVIPTKTYSYSFEGKQSNTILDSWILTDDDWSASGSLGRPVYINTSHSDITGEINIPIVQQFYKLNDKISINILLQGKFTLKGTVNRYYGYRTYKGWYLIHRFRHDSGGFVTGWDPSSVEIDKKESKLNITNSHSWNYLLDITNEFYWKFRLYSKLYDTFILGGKIESKEDAGDDSSDYLIIPSTETLKDGQLFNNNYYLKIYKNTYYYDRIGICQLIQNKESDNSFSYQLIFSESLKDIETEMGSRENMLFYIGTNEFNYAEIFEGQDSDVERTFSLEYPLLIDSDEEKTQQVVYHFLRDTSYIQLYNSLTDTQPIPLALITDEEFEIYSNEIESPLFHTNISSGLNIPNLIANVSNKNIYINEVLQDDIVKTTLKLYSNNRLIDTTTLDSPLINYNYPFLTKDNIYNLEAIIEHKNGLQKTFQVKSQFTTDYTSDLCKVIYDFNKKAIKIPLNTPLNLPYYDSNTGEIFTNSEGEMWQVDFLSEEEYQDYQMIHVKASIYRYDLNDNNEILNQHLIINNLELVPQLNYDHLSYFYDTNIYDYGVANDNKYQYEIFYTIELVKLGDKSYSISKTNYIDWIDYEFMTSESNTAIDVIKKDGNIIEDAIKNYECLEGSHYGTLFKDFNDNYAIAIKDTDDSIGIEYDRHITIQNEQYTAETSEMLLPYDYDKLTKEVYKNEFIIWKNEDGNLICKIVDLNKVYMNFEYSSGDLISTGEELILKEGYTVEFDGKFNYLIKDENNILRYEISSNPNLGEGTLYRFNDSGTAKNFGGFVLTDIELIHKTNNHIDFELGSIYRDYDTYTILKDNDSILEGKFEESDSVLTIVLNKKDETLTITNTYSNGTIVTTTWDFPLWVTIYRYPATLGIPILETQIISSPRISDTIKIDDWIGVCLYGTEHKYELNKQNRYELDPNQIWYFDLDTKADQIDFTNERNIYTNLSSLPKVGISNVNYMTQSITTKLGYLNEDDMYVADNGYKLNKFAEWAQDGSIKILRLRNGYLIPVDIQLKSNSGNYTVVGTPSDISFQWTQIGDHKTSVLYSVE